MKPDETRAGEIVKALREMLPPKEDYAELVGAEGWAHGQHYVWTDPEPYHIEAAIALIESLQAQLAESRRREKAASSFIAKNCPQCEPVEGGIPYCSNYNIACDGCEHIWRGPQKAGKGEAG